MFRVRKKVLKAMSKLPMYQSLLKTQGITYHTYGYLIEDEERQDMVYLIPVMLGTIQHDQLDTHLTDAAFPVKRSFLEEVDSTYIDEESDRDMFRSELQRYDDESRGIVTRANSKYFRGKINRNVYQTLRQRLRSVEAEASAIEEQLKRAKSMTRSI